MLSLSWEMQLLIIILRNDSEIKMVDVLVNQMLEVQGQKGICGVIICLKKNKCNDFFLWLLTEIQFNYILCYSVVASLQFHIWFLQSLTSLFLSR